MRRLSTPTLPALTTDTARPPTVAGNTPVKRAVIISSSDCASSTVEPPRNMMR
jgi:hypothetical protein